MSDPLEQLFEELDWPDVGETNGLEGHVKGQFLRNIKPAFNRCLAPEGDCPNTAIRAHAVQNSRVLELLQADGHLKTFVQSLDKEGKLQITIESMGRNKATTFEGFCGAHDATLFEPIDRGSLTLLSDEQLLLLAYRAVSREVYAAMDGAQRLQLAYQAGVAAGKFDPNKPSKAGMLPLRHMLIAHASWTYKADLDCALLARDFTKLKHKIIEFDDTRPSVAAAACFTVPTWESSLARITLNVLPLDENKTVAIFSYVDSDEEAMLSMIGPIFDASGAFCKYLVSKLLLTRCENTVIAPSLFQTWPADKVALITDYFSQTISGYANLEDQRLYLFAE